MAVLYKSTRSDRDPVSASQAILQGLSEDGGLFVPDHMPKLDVPLKDLAGMNYREVAFEVMKLFLSDFSEEELKDCIRKAYDEKFDNELIAPIRQPEQGGAYYLELFHGATIAFKDMALSILPHLMRTAAAKNRLDREIVILTATSGDTGKAALAGFAGVPGTKIIVFYPKNGVSSIQERQMVTQTGDNTCVAGIMGNFDDAQSGVKAIFTDPAVKEKLDENGYQFSSANSINIGRLVPQIVYYVYAYTRLLAEGSIKESEEINFVVPTGNFGNILAGYYAKQMGLPVKKLICASNANKVLYDFFGTGIYDRNREFILTSSPSMDILISSNLERLIYHIAGDDPAANAAYMSELAKGGKYAITDKMRDELADFAGGFATEEETAAEIARLYKAAGYVIDPHTAVASSVYESYRKASGDTTAAVIVSTASPFKFESSVMKALGQEHDMDDLALADKLSELSGVPVPAAVSSLKGAPVRHTRVCEKNEMLNVVKDFLGIE